MLTCSECLEQLSLYLDNMLEDTEKNEMKMHLQSCEACTQALESLRENAQQMSRLNVDPPEQFSVQWRTAVRDQARIKNRKWTLMRQAGLVAAALVVALTAWRVWPAINGSNLNGSVKMEQRVMEAPQIAADQAPTDSLKMAKIAPEAAPVPVSTSEAVAGANPATEQAQILMSEAPAETQAPEPHVPTPDAQMTDTSTERPQAFAATASPEGGSMAVTDTPMSIASDVTAQDAQIALGVISFRFTGIGLDAANSIASEALNRLGIKAVVAEGVINIPPMSSQESTALLETVRAISTEKNVSDVLIACSPSDVMPATTQIIVSVQ